MHTLNVIEKVRGQFLQPTIKSAVNHCQVSGQGRPKVLHTVSICSWNAFAIPFSISFFILCTIRLNLI